MPKILLHLVVFTVVLVALLFVPPEFFMGLSKGTAIAFVGMVWASIVGAILGFKEMDKLSHEEPADPDAAPSAPPAHH